MKRISLQDSQLLTNPIKSVIREFGMNISPRNLLITIVIGKHIKLLHSSYLIFQTEITIIMNLNHIENHNNPEITFTITLNHIHYHINH